LRKAAKRIDVWHALLSFQGTPSPDPSARKTAPYRRRETERTSILRRTFQFSEPHEPRQRTRTAHAPVGTRRLTPEEALGKIQPLRGSGI